jgi:hypothetical protein
MSSVFDAEDGVCAAAGDVDSDVLCVALAERHTVGAEDWERQGRGLGVHCWALCMAYAC